MDNELKGFLFEILKNQARILTEISRLREIVQPEIEENSDVGTQMAELYEKIADTKLPVMILGAELFESEINGGKWDKSN